MSCEKDGSESFTSEQVEYLKKVLEEEMEILELVLFGDVENTSDAMSVLEDELIMCQSILEKL